MKKIATSKMSNYIVSLQTSSEIENNYEKKFATSKMSNYIVSLQTSSEIENNSEKNLKLQK